MSLVIRFQELRRIIFQILKNWGYLLYNWIHNRVDWKNQENEADCYFTLDELKYFTDTPTDANEQAESLKKFFKNKKAVELVYKKMFQYFKDKEIVKYHEKRNMDPIQAISNMSFNFLSLIHYPAMTRDDKNKVYMVNVSGFEDHLPNGLIEHFMSYDKSTNSEKASKQELQKTPWWFHKKLTETINNYIKKYEYLLDKYELDKYVENLKMLKTYLFEDNKEPSENEIMNNLSEKNYTIPWINNDKLTNLNKSFNEDKFNFFELKEIRKLNLISILQEGKFTENQKISWEKFCNREIFNKSSEVRDIYMLKTNTGGDFLRIY